MRSSRGLIGRPCDVSLLPQALQDWLAFKAGVKGTPIPDVPFQMLASLPLTTRHWTKIAERGGWQMVRMNLNTFQRHGVFENRRRRLGSRPSCGMRMRSPARGVFPYQLLAAWKHADPALPAEIREALQDAMEIAVGNVPKLPGVVAVCPDVSGSMSWATTGRARARRPRCAASTWQACWRRQCCARTGRPMCCRSSRTWSTSG